MLVELSAIIVVPIMSVVLYKHRHVFNLAFSEDPPTAGNLLPITLIQFFFQIATDFVVLVLYQSQHLPIYETFSVEKTRTILWEVFNYVQMIALILPLIATLPFRAFCSEYGNPCTCKNLQMDLFSSLCNSTNSTVTPYLR